MAQWRRLGSGAIFLLKFQDNPFVIFSTIFAAAATSLFVVFFPKLNLTLELARVLSYPSASITYDDSTARERHAEPDDAARPARSNCVRRSCVAWPGK